MSNLRHGTRKSDRRVEPAEWEPTEHRRGDVWVSELLEDVNRQLGIQALKLKVIMSKGSVSSSSRATSPAISRGKDMNMLKEAIAKEKEEEKRKKAAKEKEQAKTGKQKVGTPSSSSGSRTTSFSEGEGPAEKMKVIKWQKAYAESPGEGTAQNAYCGEAQRQTRTRRTHTRGDATTD